jgi:hypothetical protein
MVANAMKQVSTVMNLDKFVPAWDKRKRVLWNYVGEKNNNLGE